MKYLREGLQWLDYRMFALWGFFDRFSTIPNVLEALTYILLGWAIAGVLYH